MSIQNKPDFTGEWSLDRQACSLSPGADAMQSGIVRIEHRDPTLRYKGTFTSAGGEVKTEFELLSDGKEVVNSDHEMTIVSRLRWDGDILEASWHIQRSAGEMKISFRYELLDGGKRLRAVEQLRSSGHNQDNVWIFERRRSD